MKAFEEIKNALFPIKCAGCEAPGQFVCATCNSSFLKIVRPSCPFCRTITGRGETCNKCRRKHKLNGSFAGARITSELKNALHKLKYMHGRETAPYLARLLIEQIELHGAGFKNVLIVPVPEDPKRGRDRLYNPPDILANMISSHFGYPSDNLLKKNSSTPQQAGLSRPERLRNLEGKFELKQTLELTGRTVILIDDVATTYSTLESAAREINKLNPRRIWSAVVAHGKG